MTTDSKTDLARAAQLFHALSDETRLGLLDMLRGGERCVCDLQGDFNAAQSRLSYHLKILKIAGLVSDRQEGRWSYYTIRPDAMVEIQQMVSELADTAVTPIFAASATSKRTLPLADNAGGCC